MPIDNLGNTHLTDSQINEANTALDRLMALFAEVGNSLSPKERVRFGKVGAKKELLINKVKELHDFEPNLSSPEVDWDEFAADYNDRVKCATMLMKLRAIESAISDFKILRDYDNYTDTLRDYQYSLYKKRFSTESGHASKAESIKPLFGKSGYRKKKE